jgi:hypothetical protein
MSVSPRPGLVALAAAGSLLLLAATPASALASGRGDKPTPDQGAHNDKGAHHDQVIHFNAHGTVVSAAGNTAVVLARTVEVQHQGVRQNVSITVTLTPGALKYQGHGHGKKAPTTAGLIVGDLVELQGTETGSGPTEVFTVTRAEQHAQVAHVFLGTITTVNGTLIQVAKGGEASDDPTENGNGRHGLSVDVSKATVTVDGVAGTLAVGQTVAILGEADHDAVLAASVYAFTVAPTVLTGEVSTVTGTQVTFGHEDKAVTVDLASVPLIVNGNAGAALTSVPVGAKIVVLGTTTAGVFTPSLAFAFNNADKHPVGWNHDH